MGWFCSISETVIPNGKLNPTRKKKGNDDSHLCTRDDRDFLLINHSTGMSFIQ